MDQLMSSSSQRLKTLLDALYSASFFSIRCVRSKERFASSTLSPDILEHCSAEEAESDEVFEGRL